MNDIAGYSHVVPFSLENFKNALSLFNPEVLASVKSASTNMVLFKTLPRISDLCKSAHIKLVLSRLLLVRKESLKMEYIINVLDRSAPSNLEFNKLDCTRFADLSLEFEKLELLKEIPFRYALDMSLLEKSFPSNINFRVRLFILHSL
ncbi:MAG: hypothetical protein M3M88_00340, partial [Thermoproteota archaeon]|nr:hypothetical protein [Thermoproteota archaeon]